MDALTFRSTRHCSAIGMSGRQMKAVILLTLSALEGSFGLKTKLHATTLRTRARVPPTMPLQSKSVSEEGGSQNEGRDSLSRRMFFQDLTTGTCSALCSVARTRDASAMQVPDITAMTSRSGPNKQRIGGLANTIRNSCKIMDELQRDLMQENWNLVESYPNQLRSYVPVFTAYTDSAFPSDAPTDKGLRVALRYEVGRFFASVERFKQATSRRALDEAYVAYSDMSLHLDRYLRVGGLYTYYDDTVSLEPYYKGISESALVYADPKKDPPEVRDLVIMAKGPDKGKTGIVIGIYRDGTDRVAVKLDRFKGMREIRVVPKLWVAKRLGEQPPDDVFILK